MTENQSMENYSHLVPFTSDSSSMDLVSQIPSFGSRNFSKMVSHENCQNSDDGALGSLPNGKRKRVNVGVEQQQNDQNVDTCEFPKGEEKKSKQAAKPSKENYIVVRAKRGQATNSHSLAERFLSMKLATVNPELNVDIERLLTKNLLHPQAGLDSGFGSSAFTGLHNNLWNNELQSILQLGFDSHPSLGSLGENGLSKMDL
ncbi:basic helix-loop-helix (bHLH) DNA-bindingsuperfamily protein [Striga asiatica]|uniref:Basic helix-loop-helix (BHLH) DNA-bindingsuperfamily protein n=1 Tax=Striga asiatica TaxID=4170 RepID=A0A5A7PDU5_STRAF|nr:basic helix-loop-helix (bHLH) DNA-bindingsuperfamily protein [Striga asiatica]